MPTHEPSNHVILKAVTNLAGTLTDLKKEVRDLSKQVGANTSGLRDVQETVDFLKDNAITRDEFKLGLETGLDGLERKLRTEIRETRNEMISHVDHFIQLHKKQEVEHLALVSRVSRHEESTHHS
jgi:predicted  nucleic acid-binding Zn-ribbon protein